MIMTEVIVKKKKKKRKGGLGGLFFTMSCLVIS